MATEIPIIRISVAERQRPIDPNVVADLARSIKQHGLLQPIGVKPLDGDGYELIFGAHRLEAFKALQRETIPASVFAVGLSTDESRLLEMRENLDRNDLTGAQRKSFAAEAGRLAKLRAEAVAIGNGNADEIGNDRWLRDLAGETGIPDRTLYGWWSAFCQSAGVNITPKQASSDQQEEFFAWLTEHERDRRRKAEVAQAQEREAACQALQAHLDKAAAEYGIDCVKDWVDAWLRREQP